MIALPQLIPLNNRAAKGALAKRDNFNRECSFCASRGGFVIHSGVHRSTAFIHPDICEDTYFAAQYWLGAEPATRDEFITQIVGGASLDDADERAFRAARPDWRIVKPKCRGSQGNAQITAVLPGTLETRVAAYTWRHLHARTASRLSKDAVFLPSGKASRP